MHETKGVGYHYGILVIGAICDLDMSAKKVEPGDSYPLATAAQIQLIYGDNPNEDVVACDITQLMKHSTYLKGRLDAQDCQKIQIQVESPETFIKYIVPYMVSGDKIDFNDVADEVVLRLVRDAELLGIQSLLGDLLGYIGRNLERILSNKYFRCKWISKDSLLEAMQYRMANEGIKMSSTECKEFHLCVLINWLADSDEEECQAMNVWFAEKLECTWMELIEKGFSDETVKEQIQTGSVFSRFFTQEDMNRLLLKLALGKLGGEVRECEKCGVWVPKPDQAKAACLGNPAEDDDY